ncbi:hypothetical protein [Nonomuraea solani]|nr:hypothetical protein [Nonomuraea solani]
MDWFEDEFGEEVALREVALPTPGFFRSVHNRFGTVDRVNALVSKVRRLMAVDVSTIEVEFFDGVEAVAGERTVGHYYQEGSSHVVGFDRKEVSDLAYLTAVIAHELCHVRLIGEGRISAEREDQERLTDLLTVYLGFGVFTANAAMKFARASRGWQIIPRGYLTDETLNSATNNGETRRLGYLTQPEFGYALARYCRLRGESRPSWIAHLHPGARTALTQSQAGTL